MKNGKKIFIILLIIVILGGIVGALYFYFHNSNKLSSTEKRFLADNANTIQNINVINNIDIFGESGEGLYYDFLKDFSSQYGIDVNPVAFNLGESAQGLFLGTGNSLNKNEIAFFEDHYVLVSLEDFYINSLDKLKNQKIGVLANDLSYVISYLDNKEITLTAFEDKEKLFKSFSNKTEIEYMILPLHLYLKDILSSNYNIVYHFGDMKYYYKLNVGDNNTLGDILKKYYNIWQEKKQKVYYQDHLFNLFVESFNISLTEIDAMRSINYNYGFINNSPYEILIGGNYGGILAQYLREFTDFSKTELNFNKYKNYNQLKKAINAEKVNIYFDYYNVNNSFLAVHTDIGINYKIMAPKKDNLIVHSLKSLEGQEVYVENNTNLYNYLINNTKLSIKTYSNRKNLEKLIKKGKIIIIDENIYEVEKGSLFNSYNSRCSFKIDKDYLFNVKGNETFNKLFKAFVQYKDVEETIYLGIYNYDKTLQNGTITGKIAKYFMYLLIVFVAFFLYIYKVAKRVKTTKKLKKEDKLKYIDQLTSLKNRNYLNDNIESWSKNTIYPQTIIVVDLNNLQYINDTLGYEQGDVQIKSAANILVKNQLDNSDIMRTDGNEFVIYLIGYQMKQITSYIHKLNKEFKKLPYEYGAAIGYSMIEDEIKSVEDAINEAVEEVKKQKNNKKEAS